MADGRIIKGKYRIVREIGRGAMGIVYEVRHEELGSTLALKQLQLNLETNPDIARRFRHEARMMARLQHPNIVRVWDIDSEAEFGTFLVMEFINGPDLGKTLRTRRLTYPEVLRIGGAVASALHTAHREGLVHRDVKPANILIEENSMRAVVTDFGIAKQMKSDSEDSTVGTVGFLGTYRYSSPEQIRSERGVSIDGRADIYSLGVVLYEMYSGKKFLEGLSEGQITHLVGFQPDWRPTLEYVDVPPQDFGALIEQCLVRNRDERIADAGQVVQRLEGCLRAAVEVQRLETIVVGTVSPPPPAHPAEAEATVGTAITRLSDEGEVQQPDPRVIEEIERLHSAVEAEMSQLHELRQEHVAIGAAPADGEEAADVAQRLEAIEGLRQSAEFESARTALEELRAQLVQAREQHVASLREALARRLNDLREQWRALTEAAGDFLTPDQARQCEDRMESADRALADGDRQAVVSWIADGQQLRAEAQRSAGARADTAVRQALGDARALMNDLHERSADAALRLELNLDEVESEVHAALSAGRLQDAKTRAEAAVAAVSAAARDGLEGELRVLLTRAAEAPAEIVGEARLQAQALLDAPPADMSAALSAMAQARSTLTAGIEEAVMFTAAAAARAAAQAAQQRVADLGASWRQRRRGNTAMERASSAFTRRQWAAARDAYAQSVEVLVALEQELSAQRGNERAAAARRQLDEALAAVDLKAAAALAPEELARAEAVQAEATQAAERGDAAAAVAAYENATAAYRAAAERVLQRRQAQYQATQQALRELVERAATAPAALVDEERSRAEELLSTPPPQDVAVALAAMEQARSGLTAALDAAPLFTAIGEARAAAAERQARVRTLGATRRQLAESDRLMKAAAAAVERRQWTVARDTYAQADAALAALEEEVARQHAQAAATAAVEERPSAGAVMEAAALPARRFPATLWLGGAAVVVVAVVIAMSILQPQPVTVARKQGEQPAAEPAAAARPAPPGEARPPIPAVPHVVKALPPSDTVTVREGARQPFSVVFDGVAADERPATEWKLNDEVVARNVAEWEYAPDYRAAGGAPRTLTVVLGGGREPDQAHTWRVTVEDVNRRPVLREASHAPASTITAKIGETVNLRVKVADDDDDPLKYSWMVDGKPAGTSAPELNLPVAAENQRISLSVSDGKDNLTTDWRIAALAPLKLDVSPARLDTLRFNEPQEFTLALPSGQRAAGIQYAWKLDGQKVADAARFVLKEYKPSMVRSNPMVITATAQDDQGRSFSYEWKPRVLPPAPELKTSSPPTDRALDAELSRPQAFVIEASVPLGNQRFTYVYEVDGRAAWRDGNSRFAFTPSDEKPHEIAGYVEDNYQQVSRQRFKWKVQASIIVSRVQDWLKQYERAWNTQDATQLGQLRGLDTAQVAKLQESFKEKTDLRVTFSALKIEKLDGNHAKASYARLDEWVAKDGVPVARSRNVEQNFRLTDNKLQEAEVSRREPSDAP